MQPPSTPPQKYNPYYLPVPEGCGKRTDCPYKSMPEYLQPSDFKNEILSSFDDHYCSLCKSQLKLVPPPPPPPRPHVEETTKKDPDLRPWYRKYRWAILAALLLLIAGLVYWFWFRKSLSPAPVKKKEVCQRGDVVAGRDTCVNEVRYQVVCDGKGGYDKGKKVGSCGPVVVFPAAGKIIGTDCRGKTLHNKVTDGKGGYNLVHARDNSITCFEPDVPHVVKRGGRCQIEIYHNGMLKSQTSVPVERQSECANAPKAPKLR
ncbi:hypothetical protein [Larkinella humicola]|uniref:Uncharacterized protein n=1 Tax=Larkinella humicola TaxID=2607654 RepID=A0A5N1JAZ8_9BACT|nr:hypothetical protein [Larkinella humicola]KAA9349852.1 hypothetical protein F0P93_20640 [Larkinella humicola]